MTKEEFEKSKQEIYNKNKEELQKLHTTRIVSILDELSEVTDKKEVMEELKGLIFINPSDTVFSI